MEHNFATIFEAVADEIPEVAALARGDLVLDWRAVDDRAARLAGWLGECGVHEGSVVIIGVSNRPEHVEALLATAKLRAISANLNYRYREAEIECLLNDCEARVVIADRDLAERVLAVRDRTPSVAAVVAVGDSGDADGTAELVEYEDALAVAVPAARISRSGDDRFMIYTGGTTGMPRATVWRHSQLGAIWLGNFAAAGRAVPNSLPAVSEGVRVLAAAERRTVALPAAPLIHATGLHTAMGALVAGGMVVFSRARSFDPAEIWQAVARRGVTTLTIVGDAFARPLLAELRAASDRGEPYDVSTVTRIASSGTIWSADVKAGLLGFVDARLVDLLASSEGGPYAMSETTRGAIVPTSRFRLAPMARLIDEHDNDVEPGSGIVGLLASSNVAPDGYLGDVAKSAATFRVIGGVRWSVPGDRAMLDADGTLVLLGRDSSIINTGGEKVFAEEVENVLVEHPEVDDVLVAPAPDERWGSIVTAIVQATDRGVDEDELSTFVGGRLAGYKRPRRYVFVPEIRRSPAGKADRQWAAAIAENRTP